MADNITYVRTQFIAPEKAPMSDATVIGWLRKNLFASITDSILTIVAIAALLYYLPGAINWLFLSAVWTGADRTACLTTVQGGALPEGWSGVSAAPVGKLMSGFAGMLDTLSMMGDVPEELSELSRVLGGLGGEMQRLGIDFLVSTNHTSATSFVQRMRW